MKHFIFLLLLFPTFLFAQEKTKTAKSLKGTYQIEFLKTAKQPFGLTPEFVEKIEANRKEDLISYLQINSECRIKIFPKHSIQNSDKKEVEEMVFVEKFTN